MARFIGRNDEFTIITEASHFDWALSHTDLALPDTNSENSEALPPFHVPNSNAVISLIKLSTARKREAGVIAEAH
jgi:hypothetical protein